MTKKLYEAYRRCTCDHIKGHHHVDEPYACRLCECESFMPRKHAKVVTKSLPAMFREYTLRV